jgi:hypothetical protein
MLAATLLAALALSLWVASHEWFTRDDFAFLAYVQLPERFGWREAYLPLGGRFWPFYRPLAMETYFWAGFRLFGLDAFGYFATSLALHFASAALVYRLARRFGMGAAVALATAVFAVTRPPSLLEIYWGSVFMYVGATAFTLLSADRFLAGLESRASVARAGSLLASCAALLAALLCNEIAVATPAVLGLVAVAAGERSPRRLARALAPHAALVAAYLGFRFGLLAPAQTSALYAPALGVHVAGNAASLVQAVFGGAWGSAGVGVLALLGMAAVRASRARRSGTQAWLARVAGACLAWAALVALPFAMLPFAQPRWAMNLEAPLALAFGALLEAARSSLPARRIGAFDAVLAALLVAVVPWPALVRRGLAPEGERPRQLVRVRSCDSSPTAAAC